MAEEEVMSGCLPVRLFYAIKLSLFFLTDIRGNIMPI